jgi:hypothetical protein
MSQKIRAWVALILTITLICGAAFGRSASRDYLVDLWHYNELQNQLDQAEQQHHNLEFQLSDIHELLAFNESLLDAVLERRMTLLEAVELKWARNQHRTDWVWIIDTQPHGTTRTEKLAYHFVELAVKHVTNPKKRLEVAQWLDEELCRLTSQDIAD